MDAVIPEPVPRTRGREQVFHWRQSTNTNGIWEAGNLVSDTMIGEKTMIHDAWSPFKDSKTWTHQMSYGSRQ